MQALLKEAEPRDDEVRVAFARAARLALAGLLAAPALLGLASAAGLPLRAAANPAFWVCSLAGFGGAGWLAGRRLGIGPRQGAALAGVFLLVGLIVAPALRGLQGLTGREPVFAVLAATLLAFASAFVLAGILAGRVLHVARLRTRGIAVCAAGGVLGAIFAALPFCWAWLRFDVPGRTYVVMALAVVGFLGCLIAPFHITGLALDLERGRK
jgi:FtsH-binding integral membrane protein